MRDLEGHRVISWSPTSHGTVTEVFYKFKSIRLCFTIEGAIKKGCNPEKEHHLLIELFINSTNTSFFFIFWRYFTVKIIMIYFNIKINFHYVHDSHCLEIKERNCFLPVPLQNVGSSVPPGLKGQHIYNANSEGEDKKYCD